MENVNGKQVTVQFMENESRCSKKMLYCGAVLCTFEKRGVYVVDSYFVFFIHYICTHKFSATLACSGRVAMI